MQPRAQLLEKLLLVFFKVIPRSVFITRNLTIFGCGIEASMSQVFLKQPQSLANETSIGDLTTLEDETSVEEIIRSYHEVKKGLASEGLS